MRADSIFYVLSDGHAATVLNRCNVQKNVGILYAFEHSPTDLFFGYFNSEKSFENRSTNEEGEPFNLNNIQAFLKGANFSSITKPMYLAWYLNNHFHQHSNAAKILRSKLIECPNLWKVRENRLEIEDHKYMDKMGDVWELNDYIDRLSRIFKIADLVKTREFCYIGEEASLTTQYFVIREEHIERLTEIALEPPTFKSLLFNQINKQPDQEKLVTTICTNLKAHFDLETWSQKSKEEKIEMCCSFFPESLRTDPRFLLLTYPDLQAQLLKDVEKELGLNKCLIM